MEGRLSYEQCKRLIDMNDYLQQKRPEIEWRGKKMESMRMSDGKWKEKLATTLYCLYNDMYIETPISREEMNDFFDDNYVAELMSLKNELMNCVKKIIHCCN